MSLAFFGINLIQLDSAVWPALKITVFHQGLTKLGQTRLVFYVCLRDLGLGMFVVRGWTPQDHSLDLVTWLVIIRF